MTDLQVRVQSVPRTPGDDESLGMRLVELVRGALARGGAPSAAVVVSQDRLDIVPLAPVVQAKLDPTVFLAGLTRAPFGGEPVEAVGLIGTFRLVRRAPGEPRASDTPGVPLSMVFLEWADCRWWQWRALLDDGVLRDETETYARAVDGDARPGRLGGWWSLGRRREIGLKWNRKEPTVVH